MRAHDVEDDRWRAVMHLQRSASTTETHDADATGHEASSPSDDARHLGADELAALVAGTLLPSECIRLEGHLLACTECRTLAHRLHEDFEAGAAPMLLRRSTTVSPRTAVHVRVTRRVTPWVLAALAALVVVFVPFSIDRWFSRTEFVAPEAMLVIARDGTPVVKSKEGVSHRPAEIGTWLEAGDELIFDDGDLLRAIGRDGSMHRIDRDGRETETEPATDLADLFARIDDDRPRLLHDLQAPVQPEPVGVPSLLHPRGPTYSTRPSFRWSDSVLRRGYRIRVVREGDAPDVVLEESVEGRELRYPRRALPLEPGHRYTVYLVGREPDSRTNSEVIVLDGSARRNAETTLARIADVVTPRVNLLRAEYCRQHGLLGEAREELESLLVGDPDNLEILGRLEVVSRQLGLPREVARMRRLREERAR